MPYHELIETELYRGGYIYSANYSGVGTDQYESEEWQGSVLDLVTNKVFDGKRKRRIHPNDFVDILEIDDDGQYFYYNSGDNDALGTGDFDSINTNSETYKTFTSKDFWDELVNHSNEYIDEHGNLDAEFIKLLNKYEWSN